MYYVYVLSQEHALESQTWDFLAQGTFYNHNDTYLCSIFCLNYIYFYHICI